MQYTPRFIVKTSLIAIVCGFITGYSIFQSQNLISGPTITILTPQDGLSAQSEVAEITGQAKNIAFLSFNGRQIYTDVEGTWSEKLVLADGYNIVKLTATDKFGRSVVETIELVYEREGGSTLTAHNALQDGKANN